MSLTAWMIIYIVDILFFGWMFNRDRGLRREAGRPFIWLFVILFSTVWFIAGLIFPEARLFLFAG